MNIIITKIKKTEVLFCLFKIIGDEKLFNNEFGV